jgi:hypothetical protein
MIMFDIFTKSKVEPMKKSSATLMDRSVAQEDAWRIAHAIDRALKSAETERKELASRIEDAMAWAAVSLGNGNDEYLERELLDTIQLDRFYEEIRGGDRQASRLDQSIACYKLLKTTILAGFPELCKNELLS